MNVFGSIKDTILGVPKDITSGIKALTTKDSARLSSDHELAHSAQVVNFEAGGKLLEKFQNSWSEIHSSSEDNAKRAKIVDGQVTELFIYLERQNDAVNQFLLEISSLPQIVSDLQVVSRKIEALAVKFEEVENELANLEDVCEEQELAKNKKHHQYQLETYRQRGSTELEQAKLQLARNHAGKIQRYERFLQRTLSERQKEFETTFRDEVQYYKKYGTTNPSFKQSPTKQPASDDLETFVPEQDDRALDDFLKSDTNPTANATDITADPLNAQSLDEFRAGSSDDKEKILAVPECVDHESDKTKEDTNATEEFINADKIGTSLVDGPGARTSHESGVSAAVHEARDGSLSNDGTQNSSANSS